MIVAEAANLDANSPLEDILVRRPGRHVVCLRLMFERRRIVAAEANRDQIIVLEQVGLILTDPVLRECARLVVPHPVRALVPSDADAGGAGLGDRAGRQLLIREEPDLAGTGRGERERERRSRQ